MRVATHTRGHSAAEPVGRTTFNDLLAQQGAVVFLSWDGKWIGTDCDTIVTFERGGSVVLSACGVSVRHHYGTYQVDANGTVTLNLPTYQGGYPPVYLDLDARSLMLRPVTPRSWDASEWPFRRVDKHPFEDIPTTRPAE